MRNTSISFLVVPALALMGLASVGCNKGGEGGGVGVAPGAEMTVLFASNNNGEIEPCG